MKTKLLKQIQQKRSFLCIGLDTDIKKIPEHLLDEQDPIFSFNKIIIEQTNDLCIAYKPNIAFYESMGYKGMQSLEKTVQFLQYQYPNILLIADAKRGDIGNTSSLYARAFFEHYNFDAITVAPYMGEDSVKPFLAFDNKWVILLALTSNKGADDFQMLESDSEKLYEHVLKISQKWADSEKMMYVVGATRAEMLAQVRKHIPNHFLLVPGVGKQGGSLQEVVKYGINSECGLIVNSSRAIIYASNGKNFGQVAREQALIVKQEMDILLKENGL